jgi:hypothetical protein
MLFRLQYYVIVYAALVCVNLDVGVFIVILPGEVLMFILLLMCLSLDISKEMD